MFARLSGVTIRHRVLVTLTALFIVVVTGLLSGDVADRLSSGGYADPTADSTIVDTLLAEHFDAGEPNYVLVVTAATGDVDEPAVAAFGTQLTATLARDERVVDVASYWSLGNAPPLRSTDGRTAIVAATLAGDDDEIQLTAAALTSELTGISPVAEVRATGLAQIYAEISEAGEHDAKRAERLAMPLTLLLLLLVFGTAVAALLPLAIGMLTVTLTTGVLYVLGGITEVSIHTLSVSAVLGLGLAIDYALFVVSRFREELTRGLAPLVAVERTVRTAGRTVVFSAGTVAVSLAALLLFPLAFLRSIAIAGITTVLLAMIGAVIVLPALLALLGHRIERGRIRRRPGRRRSRWHDTARWVMRRPLPVASVIVALLLLVGSPFFGIRLGMPDHRQLPPQAPSRLTLEALQEELPGFAAESIAVVVPGATVASSEPALASSAAALSRLRDVERVESALGVFVAGELRPDVASASAVHEVDGSNVLWVVPDVEGMSPEGLALVSTVRELELPLEVLVGGAGARMVDATDAVYERLPWAIGWIASVTFAVLFLMFGSVLVPVKAVLLNLLSLTGTFGLMVWIFQDGHLSGPLGFTPTGSIAFTMPVLMFCVAFGLSMDYEVFLLSRIKEEHDRGADDETAVAVGLERTGGIVTSAAVLMAVVFAAMLTSGMAMLKLLGLGMSVAVLVDAFLVRATLVPAFMKLAGRANWWAPAPLRWLHERFAIREHDTDLDEVPQEEAVAPAPAPALN
jgi:putative drug exporter of the RND superfamily